jgi:hypothetical protein
MNKGKHKNNGNRRNSTPSRIRNTIGTGSGVTGTKESLFDNAAAREQGIKAVGVLPFNIKKEGVDSDKSTSFLSNLSDQWLLHSFAMVSVSVVKQEGEGGKGTSAPSR